MHRILPLLSVLTLAFWLTATQHCVLEQINVIESSCPSECAADQAAHNDGCQNVEEASYRSSPGTIKLGVPSLAACIGHLCGLIPPLDAIDGNPVAIADTRARARTWVASWHFVRRGAPLPGAPSLTAA